MVAQRLCYPLPNTFIENGTPLKALSQSVKNAYKCIELSAHRATHGVLDQAVD
jgi:hypothetical protein